MTIWLQLLVCVAAGVVAVLVEPTSWLGLRVEILTFLSVLLAAVLFRLGRGLPNLAWEGMKSEEAQHIADTFKIVGGRLVFVFTAVGGTVLWLILVESLYAAFCDSPVIAGVVAWITGFLISFSLVRAVVLVLGDRDLIALQVELVRRIMQKRRATENKRRLDEAEREKPPPPPDGYGGLHKST